MCQAITKRPKRFVGRTLDSEGVSEGTVEQHYHTERRCRLIVNRTITSFIWGPVTEFAPKLGDAVVDRAARRARYQAIEAYRRRPLIVYATSTRHGVAAQMASDAVRVFIDQIDAIPEATSVDVLVHSTGGDALTAWKLMSVLRERFDEVYVLVPFMAFSAATLFALGADEIVMHPHASLGPIDPQITIPLPDGSRRQFSYEDVGAFLRFVSIEAGIGDEVPSSVIDKLLSVVDPVNIGAAKRASELSSSVGERLLKMHMKGGGKKARAKQIAENLNKSFFAHGDAVSRSRARELNLKIGQDDATLEGLMWQAFLGLEGYMQLRSPFIPLQHFLAHPEGPAVLRPRAPLAIPPDTPPQIAQQLWNAVATNIMGNMQAVALEVDYSLVNAILEGTRIASEYRTEGKLSAVRTVKGEIQLSGTDLRAGWQSVPDENPAAAPDALPEAPGGQG